MKLYADQPARFFLQLALDVVLVTWVISWIWVGTVVNDGVETLAEPGVRISASASDLSSSLSDAGGVLEDVPVVGDGVATPFDEAAEASASMADAGDAEARAAQTVAFWLGLTVALLPILYVAPRYVHGRVRWIREASAGRRLVDGPADLEVFALRAINNQPLSRLARVTDDPVGALRRRDTPVVAALARLELDAVGLTAPGLPVVAGSGA